MGLKETEIAVKFCVHLFLCVILFIYNILCICREVVDILLIILSFSNMFALYGAAYQSLV